LLAAVSCYQVDIANMRWQEGRHWHSLAFVATSSSIRIHPRVAEKYSKTIAVDGLAAADELQFLSCRLIA
jgi:hypothetical protein